MPHSTPSFSPALQAKIDRFMGLRTPVQLGSIKFKSRVLLAPMAGICNIPFRLLMEDLGAGGTVSELVSCHGINHGNQRTLDMLKIHAREEVVGLQIFGEDADALTRAALKCEEFGPGWVDINMGCPVNKVVQKGGGSAMMKEVEKLAPTFEMMRSRMKVPLTIKIRTGWDNDQRNAAEILKIAHNSGVEFVAIHGRTRTQQYTGLADWDFIENLQSVRKLPLIGNGDLHHPILVSDRLQKTNCEAVMIARGALRNPFIFLESLDPTYAHRRKSEFLGADYWEVIERLWSYVQETFDDERMLIVQARKLIVWFAAGFPHSAAFRGQVNTAQSARDTYNITQDYFLSLGDSQKSINYDEAFMSSGHG